MKNITKYLAPVTTILLIGAFAGPASAVPTEQPREAPSVERAATQPVVTAVPASLNFEKPAVKTVAAPIPEPDPVAVQQSIYAPQAKATTKVTTAAPTTAVQPSVATQAASITTTPATVAPASGSGAALLASAYGQIGVTQDCTAMVEKALRSIGKSVGDLAPAQFFQFGSVVASPQPGDILISAGHVGIYAGNGQMISGGFNGNQTVLHPVSYVGAYSAVRVA